MAVKTYEEVVLEDSPDIFLRFAEAAGTNAADASGNGRDFTHAGSPTLDQAGPSGIGGKAVSYDGSNDQTTYSVDMPITGYPFTIEAWAKTPGTTTTSTKYCAVSVGDADASPVGDFAFVDLNADGSNNLEARIVIDNGGTLDVATGSIPNALKGEWVHLVGVFRSATDREVYVNGVSVVADATSIAFPSSFDIFGVGVIKASADTFREGFIAEPAWYNSALSEARIRIHHAVGLGFTDTSKFGYAAMIDGPAIYLTLGDASGNAVDSSGWKRDATAEGSPTYGEPGPLTDPEGDDAVKFNGSDAAFALAGDDLGITDYPLTIEMFGKTPAAPGNNTSFARLMFGDDGAEDNFFGLDLLTDGSGNPEARGLLETGGTADHLSDAVDLNADQFYHLVWRLISATERRLYVAGAEAANDTVSRAFGTGINDLVIGRDLAASPSFYAGTQGQILVYPRDIGASAVTAHFEAATINFYEETLTEDLALSDLTALQFLSTISEDVSFNDIITISWLKTLTETLELDDVLTTIMLFNNTVVEDVELSDTLTSKMVASTIVTDDFTLDDTLSSKARFTNTIVEAVAIKLGLVLGDEEYTGLVINTHNLALTKYTGYNFNSFAKVGEKYYGAADDGIYLLEGDDDAGTDIAAHLRTAIYDFGADFQKRVPRAYLGVRGDGEMYLKTITNEDEVFWYRVQDVQERFENRRVKLGRGISSAFWQFELANVDGSFFELQDMTLIPVILTRRVK